MLHGQHLNSEEGPSALRTGDRQHTWDTRNKRPPVLSRKSSRRLSPTGSQTKGLHVGHDSKQKAPQLPCTNVPTCATSNPFMAALGRHLLSLETSKCSFSRSTKGLQVFPLKKKKKKRFSKCLAPQAGSQKPTSLQKWVQCMVSGLKQSFSQGLPWWLTELPR